MTSRWEATAPSWRDGPQGEEALRVVERQTARWTDAVRSFLDVEAPASVVVSLHAGDRPPMTRRTHVRLPVRGHAGTLADALTPVNAGLAHELVHVVAGRSPSPVLNEGLAVYVDAALRLAGDVWPFYELAPHRWVQVFVERGGFVPLHGLPSSLQEASAQAHAGEEAPDTASRRARSYLEAASWTGYLFESLPRTRFWENYRAGSLIPLGWNADAAEQAWLARLGRPLTEDERRRCARSFARADNPRADNPRADHPRVASLDAAVPGAARP